MFDPEFQRKALSLVMGFIMQFSETPAEPEVQELSVNDLNVSTISVSCLKVAWDGEPEIARRRQRDEQERIAQTEERERKNRP